jgi:N-acyl homoserine lactone hydrolase
VDGDTNLCDGLDLILISSHTPGSQGVLVNTAGGKYMIAGDAIGTYNNWYGLPDYCGGSAPNQHIMPAIHVDLNACYESYRKIERLADHVLPGHDLKVYEHSVYPPKE